MSSSALPESPCPVSAIIITYNEGDRLTDCLKSLDWVNEIVVVDSGSTDNTQETAKNFGARLFVNPFEGYTRQKAYAIEKTSNPWILILDADERISDPLKLEIMAALKNSEQTHGYFLPFKTYFQDQLIRHGGVYPGYKMRLFKKTKASFTQADPHTIVKVEGQTRKLKNHILHYSYKSISHFVLKLEQSTTIAAQNLARQGKKSGVIKIVFRPWFRFIKAYFFQLGFIDGILGLVYAILHSYEAFLKYSKLKEITDWGKRDA